MSNSQNYDTLDKTVNDLNSRDTGVKEFDFDDEFDKIWEDVVIPLSKDMATQYELHLIDENIFRFRAKRLYNKYRDEFLRFYMYSDANNIDKHKVASCLTKVVLVIKPIRIPFKDRIAIRFSKDSYKYHQFIEEVLLINQYLSLSIAVTVIEGYIEAHNNLKDAAQPLKHKIEFPIPFPENDNHYLRDVCLDLYYTNPHKFNTISYANIFFLWEKYSCRKVQCMNLIDAYKVLLKNPSEYERISKLSNQEINDYIDVIRFKQRDKY